MSRLFKSVLADISQAHDQAAQDLETIFEGQDSKPPSEEFHYTSVEGFQGILESNTLWTTSLLYLNDSSEGQYGVDLLNSVLDELMVETSDQNARAFLTSFREVEVTSGADFFIACFCEEPDLLSQWRAYGGTSGYSLGFDSAVLADDRRLGVAGFRTEEYAALFKVNYDVQWQRSMFRRILDSALHLFQNDGGELDDEIRQLRNLRFAIPFILQMILICKNPAFQEEKEWRLAIVRSKAENDSLIFRRAPTHLVPTLPIDFLTEDFLKMMKVPVVSITVGPTSHPTLATDAVSRFARQLGYPAIEIKTSQIPLRI